MSQENVQIVRQMLDAGNRGGLDASSEYRADDVEWRAVEVRWMIAACCTAGRPFAPTFRTGWTRNDS
jgi:ketosteroid isomerase-like protein